jgi:hypothetical protein
VTVGPRWAPLGCAARRPPYTMHVLTFGVRTAPESGRHGPDKRALTAKLQELSEHGRSDGRRALREYGHGWQHDMIEKYGERVSHWSAITFGGAFGHMTSRRPQFFRRVRL